MNQPEKPSDKPPLSWLGSLTYRDLFVVEASGVRTTAAALLPLIWGQITGNPGMGLLVGMGGIQAAFLDFADPTPLALLYGTIASALMAFLGGWVSQWPTEYAVLMMAVLTFAMGMLWAFGDFAGNAGFVLTLSYALSQSKPVPPHMAFQYLITYGVGGVLAGVMTLLVWYIRSRSGERKVASAGAREPVWDQLRRHLTYRSPVFQHAVRTALATAVAVTIVRLYDPPHGWWLILTCMVILKPVYADTRRRLMERLGGTVLGGLLAMLPAAYIHDLATLDILLAAFGFIAFSHLPRNYGFYAFFLTPFIVLLSTVAAPTDAKVAVSRIYETLMGGGLAFGIAFFLRSPRHYIPPFPRPTGLGG